MDKFLEIINKRFTKLIVLNKYDTDKYGHIRYNCKCDCGKVVIVSSDHLKSGHTRSCGCIRIKHGFTKRGHKQPKIYRVWASMLSRCNDSKSKSYKNYGGRGITVCKRWSNKKNGFQNFLDDMGEPPTTKHSIDRIDNNKGYCEKNCRWATKQQQDRNKRTNNLITYKNETKCLTEWAEQFGINRNTLYYRIYKYNWTIEKALTTPIRKRKIK